MGVVRVESVGVVRTGKGEQAHVTQNHNIM